MREVFVFGSNLAGRHGKGAALEARKKWGAEYGVGIGPTGSAYAIPTKDAQLRPLPLGHIRTHVRNFLCYAEMHPGLIFRVTRIGCGLAGYKEEQIAPFFEGAPGNVSLPDGWRLLIDGDIPTCPHGVAAGPCRFCLGGGVDEGSAKEDQR